MRGLKRKICDSVPCREGAPFFRPLVRQDGADSAFFQAPLLQRQSKSQEQEKPDPLVEGAKTTAEKLGEYKPFKDWYEPKLEHLKYSLWDHALTEEKAAMAAFLGLNLGTFGTAFALNPQLRALLSGVNIGKAFGLIPYSPLAGFSYKLPAAGQTATGYSADFTLNPYLEPLHRRHPAFPVTGMTFGLESAYDPGKGLSLTGGKFGLDLFGGALQAQGKTFKNLSPYPHLVPGAGPDAPGSWLMREVPGMRPLDRAGYQLMLNADLLKLSPWLRRHF